MPKVFNNVECFCAKSQLFAFYGKLWYNIYRKYERDMNRKEVNRMLTKKEQKMNIKVTSFIRKCEHISKKSVIDFKGNGNEILRKDNENQRTIEEHKDRTESEENQNRDNSESDFENSKKTGDAFREILRRLKNFIR